METAQNASGLRQPFDRWPPTRELSGDLGRLEGFRIEPRHSTPLLVKIADYVAPGTAAAIAVSTTLAVMNAYPQAPLSALLTIAGPIAGYPLLKHAHRWLFRRTTRIEITRDQVRVRRWFQWSEYDRRVRHRFMLLPHDKARQERDEHVLAERQAQIKGKVEETTKYYQDSYHVVFEYLGQRVDVCTVFGLKDARALQARLSACDEIMESLARRSEEPGGGARSGSARKPGPGDIPQED